MTTSSKKKCLYFRPDGWPALRWLALSPYNEWFLTNRAPIQCRYGVSGYVCVENAVSVLASDIGFEIPENLKNVKPSQSLVELAKRNDVDIDDLPKNAEQLGRSLVHDYVFTDNALDKLITATEFVEHFISGTGLSPAVVSRLREKRYSLISMQKARKR